MRIAFFSCGFGFISLSLPEIVDLRLLVMVFVFVVLVLVLLEK